MPNPTTNPNLASAALAYANAGWYVFPLKPNTKEPLYDGGVNDASKDPKRVRLWWQRTPNANIGLALKASGLMAVDLDIKPAQPAKGTQPARPPKNGEALLYALSALYDGELKAGLTQRTLSGGKHLIFPAGNYIDRVDWEWGIDVLSAKHRYIVIEPSEVNGKRYEFSSIDEPWNDITPMPEDWAAGFKAPIRAKVMSGGDDILDKAALKVGGVKLDELHAILDKLDPSMTRDEWLRVLWGAAAQWGGTKDEKEVVEALEEWSSRTSKEGQYKKGEVAKRWREHTTKSGGKSGAGHVTWRSVRSMAREAGWSPIAIRGVDPQNWEEALNKTKNDDGGYVTAVDAWNSALFLAYSDDLAGSVRRNLLNGAIEIHKPEIAPLVNAALLPKQYDKASDWVGVGKVLKGRVSGNPKEAVVQAAVATAADIHAYDPMLKMFDQLEWDGEERIDTWLSKCCGVEPSALYRAIGRKWLIGLAARATAGTTGRGVKMDSCLVLQGAFGLGKSSVGRILGDQFYTPYTNDLKDDDIKYLMETSYVLEFDELDSFSRAEASRVKSIITTQEDKMRRKYDAVATSKPRRCVFIATTNDEEFLTKEMSERRWWVVRCPPRLFNLAWLAENRDQLLAEAYAAWNAGELPMLPDSVAQAHAESVRDVQSEHPYEQECREYASRMKGKNKIISRKEAVEAVLGVSYITMKLYDLRMFSVAMRRAGFVDHKCEGQRVWKLFV